MLPDGLVQLVKVPDGGHAVDRDQVQLLFGPSASQFADQAVQLLLQHGRLDDPGDVEAVLEHAVFVQHLDGDLFTGSG